MSFADLDLDPQLIEAIDKMGLTTPTSIQQLAIPHALDGSDLLASAPTGTGKTLAFLLPAIQHLLDFPRQKPGSPRILILTPTRELANQISEEAEKLTAGTNLKVGAIIGGISYQIQEDVLTKNMDLVVATPGRLMEYVDAEAFDCREVDQLILDEADRMLDMGFIKEMDRIAGECRWRKQTSLFSATLEGKGLKGFARDVLEDPVSVNADSSRKESGKIHQWIYLADNAKHKLELLKTILQDEEVTHTVVFVKTRERLTVLVSKLDEAGIKCGFLRGEMDQERRNLAMARFKSGEVNVLIATDVAARGIDVVDISHVINYDMPRTADIYVHRIGRTARAGKKGTAISLVEAHDMEILSKIERYTDQSLKRRIIKELRPENKESKAPVKKKPGVDPKKLSAARRQEASKVITAKQTAKKKAKSKKSKGKPSWAGKAK